MLAPRRSLIIDILFFSLIALFYVVAVFATFQSGSSGSSYGESVAFASTLVAGSVTFALGYASVVLLGGKASLRLAELLSRLNGSRHAVEVNEETKTNSRGLIRDTSIIYIPVLVILMTLALVLNIHYMDTTVPVAFQSFLPSVVEQILSALDILIKPTNVGSLRYSIEIIPIMLSFVVIAGAVPSIILPYLRKFKVTSVNGVPFHRDILLNTVGGVFGITIVLSLLDLISGLLAGNQPHYYSYVLPTLVGFSLHYSLGAYIGRERAEGIVEKDLVIRPGKRVFQGRITIQEQPSAGPS